MDAKPSSFDHSATSDGTLQDPSQPSSSNNNIDPSSFDEQTMDRDLEGEMTNANGASTNDLPLPSHADQAPVTATNPIMAPEPRIPQKKDVTLRNFLSKMDDYAPLIPDAVTDYYLTLAGLPPPPETDRRLARLLALATQKFIADVAADAYQYSRIRSTNTTSNNPLTGLGGAAAFGTTGAGGGEGAEGGTGKGKKGEGKSQPLGGPRAGFGGGGAGAGGQGRTVLTMEDLGMAVGEYGVNVRRGEFYR
ncbi:hypothetical protein B0A55_01404 [Friedmanniomyces simplex]|uniref:Transcription initiation factor TFIID subunit 10 n=1 Tax=Friedmanniomyces simplex TaxID=329884 RepID=A0A4U0Y1Z6_9PEZI|nr:hypothetical protein B0A55_01404 [Friedmanniomyces simplex]